MKAQPILFLLLAAGLLPLGVRGQESVEGSPVSARMFVEARLFADLNFFSLVPPHLRASGRSSSRRVFGWFRPGALSHLRASATFGSVLYLGRARHGFLNGAFTASCLLGRGLASSLLDPNGTVRPQFVATLGAGYQGGPRNRQHEVAQFTQVVSPGFRSDYARVLSLATNWVWVDTLHAEVKRGYLTQRYRTQRVGSVYAAAGPIELFYYNDGTPFGKNLGDGKDRYFTGGGYVGYQFANDQTWSREPNPALRLSFDRYTSYRENAFELATAMKFDYVPYRENANFFNRGSVRLGFFSDRLWGEAALNDSDGLDFQNLIHRVSGMAYHRTASKWSLSARGGLRVRTVADLR